MAIRHCGGLLRFHSFHSSFVSRYSTFLPPKLCFYAVICAATAAKHVVPCAKHGTADGTLLFAFNAIEIRDCGAENPRRRWA